jgi:hypothetical protein
MDVLFRKSTHIWTNASLTKPLRRCTIQTPCKHNRDTGWHPVTAQSGDSRHAKGSGSAIAVYPVPAGLIEALTAGFREHTQVDPLRAFLITAIYEEFHDWRNTDIDCEDPCFNVMPDVTGALY